MVRRYLFFHLSPLAHVLEFIVDIRRHAMRIKSITYARAPTSVRSLLQQQLLNSIWRITKAIYNGSMYIPGLAQLSRFVLSKMRTSTGSRLRIIAAYCIEWGWCVTFSVFKFLLVGYKLWNDIFCGMCVKLMSPLVFQSFRRNQITRLGRRVDAVPR